MSTTTTPSKSQCLREAWQELGDGATGKEVLEHVFNKHGIPAKKIASSEVSLAKTKVFGPVGKRRRRQRVGKASANSAKTAVTKSIDVGVLTQARDFIQAAGGKDEAVKAITTLVDLQL